MTYKIVIDLNRVSVDEIDSLIDSSVESTRDTIKNMLWRFIADENDKPLPEDEARAYVGKLGTADAIRYAGQVKRIASQLMDDALPQPLSAT